MSLASQIDASVVSSATNKLEDKATGTAMNNADERVFIINILCDLKYIHLHNEKSLRRFFKGFSQEMVTRINTSNNNVNSAFFL
jgi:hypothetical protein